MSNDGKRGICINCEPGRDELARSKAHRRRILNVGQASSIWFSMGAAKHTVCRHARTEKRRLVKIPVISEKKDWRPICTVVVPSSPGYITFRTNVTHLPTTDTSNPLPSLPPFSP